MTRSTALLVIPIVFVILGLAFGSRQYHWDTLERAILLEHPGTWLRSWDGSPRSQFLAFAHVLELPLASFVRLLLASPGGMVSLVVFEILCAAVALFLLGWLVMARGVAVATAMAAQATLASTWGFWRMGTGGEERILALAAALGFLLAYGRTLATGRRVAVVAATLAFAILCHLSNAVLVPFALIGLVWLPTPERMHRRVLMRGVVAGTLVATLTYALVAAWTTGVRTPLQLWDYLTFFHSEAGNDSFFLVSTRPVWDAARGVLTFFSGTRAVGILAIASLLGIVVFGRQQRVRPHHGGLHAGHLLLLVLLWSAHFLFYEPGNIESWTVPAVALVLAAAWCLPRQRGAVPLVALTVLLVAGNAGAFRALHRPMAFVRDHERIVAASAPDDIILLGGGIQNGRPLRGSLATRWFLAFEEHRTIASLHDILGITQAEFWGRPIASVQALQQQIESGRRVWFPAFVRAEFEAAERSGRVSLQVRAHGDSLFEVTGVSVPEP